MQTPLLKVLLPLWTSLVLTSCTGQLPLQGTESPTMSDIFHEQDSKAETPKVGFPASSETATVTPFQRLANPVLHMYVYPHLVTEDRVPIPGYWTVFPMYERIEYALRGEPTEASTKRK